MSKQQVRRYVVGADLHYPLVDLPTFKCMLKVIEDIRPDGFIFQGDQFDNVEISHHTKGKPIFRERGAYERNQKNFDKIILQPLEKLLKGKLKVWIQGNHERFETDLIEEMPELEGVIDHVQSLHLVDRGWEIVELGHAYVLGELTVCHGEVLSGVGNQGGVFPARKAVDMYGTNVLVAHSHSPQSFTKISPVDHKRKHMAWVNAILGNTNPAYLRNRPTAWLHGFTLVEVHPNGFFNLYPVIVCDGECSYGGVLYSAK